MLTPAGAGCAATEEPNPAASRSATTTSSPSDGKGELKIEVTGLAEGKGYVNIAVADSPDSWNGDNEEVLGLRARVTAKRMVFTFDNVPAGRVAIRLYQDENNNGKLDTNLLGVPTEGYGFSGDGSVMGRPSFQDASFVLPAAGTTAKVAVQ